VRSLPFDEEHYRRTEVGSRVLTGEPGFSVLERTWARPALDVHGMPGGFTGAGSEDGDSGGGDGEALAAHRARDDVRGDIRATGAVCARARAGGRGDERAAVHSGEAVVVGTDNPYIRAAREALETVFGRETVFIRSGGSIPIVGEFARHLGVPSVMMGFGLPDDNLHAPNEKFHIANFHHGVESVIRFLTLVGGAR